MSLYFGFCPSLPAPEPNPTLLCDVQYFFSPSGKRYRSQKEALAAMEDDVSDAPPPPRKRQATCPGVLDQGSTGVESELTESSESGGCLGNVAHPNHDHDVHKPCSVVLERLRACATEFERVGGV